MIAGMDKNDISKATLVFLIFSMYRNWKYKYFLKIWKENLEMVQEAAVTKVEPQNQTTTGTLKFNKLRKHETPGAPHCEAAIPPDCPT